MNALVGASASGAMMTMEVPLSNYCVELSIILTGPFVNGAVLTALERAGIQLLTVISAYVFSGSLWAEDDGAD
jgi:hypothetical protein